MAQLYRDQFAHYLNTATTTGEETTFTWVREGIGVDALSFDFNPQIDQFKTILDRNASATFKNYQIQSSVSDKRIDSDDEIYDYINGARKGATAIETQLLEIDMADAVSSGVYSATKYDVLIVINNFLGEDATISYDIYVKGSPVQGTATINAQGVPSFTPSVSA